VTETGGDDGERDMPFGIGDPQIKCLITVFCAGIWRCARGRSAVFRVDFNPHAQELPESTTANVATRVVVAWNLPRDTPPVISGSP
jgi:hypothetical protein